jgi:tripartite-type tricarboxylate transporter receptor subunit TctC
MATQDLLAGRIDFICEQISTAVQQIRAGNVKGLATLGLSRTSALPELATAQEQGLGDLDCPSWSAFAFPKRTPEAIVQRLLEATNKAVETAFVRERFDAVGVSIIPPERRTREYLLKLLPVEMAKQAEVVKAGGLTAE